MRRATVGRERLRLVLLAAAILATGCGRAPTADVVLRGGTIIDGTGRSAFVGDVAVTDGTIAAVGDIGALRGTEEIDVTGRVVAPGFINLHSHARYEGLPTAGNMLGQGVTTEIINADGGGPLDLDGQLREIEAAGLAINVGTNVALGRIWAEVNGSEATRPSAVQLAEMNRLVLQGLRQGAWGVAAGLDYKPSYYSMTAEIITVLDGTAPWRTVFTNHDRITPESGFSSMVGMRETVEIGEATGLMPIITHMKVQGHEAGSIDEVTAMMDAAADRGVYTAADAYPYLAGQTSLSALIIPGWAQEGGPDAARARFADPELRARIVREADEALTARFGGPEGVYLPERRVELTTMMRELDASSGGEAVVRILETENPPAILRFGIESDLEGILRYPATSVSCDCDAAVGEVSHPRGYGTFPRVLGRYVRERGVLTLEEAIRKMSGLPATTIGMLDRGFVAPGLAADLVILDPETVIDNATFEEPSLPSTGIEHVLVNGVFAWRNGALTGERAGRALRRPVAHPARPLALEEGRSASFDGAVVPDPGVGGLPFRLTLEVQQSGGDAFAEGFLEAVGEGGERRLSHVRLGLLQTYGSWAAISLRLSDENGIERGGYVVVDSEDPVSDGTTVVIAIEGREAMIGRSEAMLLVR
ncbi:MAG: N-acyl-D-amino-acid deacylase family protein [Longimicrobiales bacterium]